MKQIKIHPKTWINKSDGKLDSVCNTYMIIFGNFLCGLNNFGSKFDYHWTLHKTFKLLNFQ